MTNEKKAIKIVEQYETRYNDTRDLLWTDLEDIAMQAMQWKEQQMIDKAVDFLKQDLFSEELVEDEKTYVCSATASTIDEFINNFKKYMED